MATPAGIQISAAGAQLNMNSSQTNDNIAIPAPNTAGWVFTVTGTGFDRNGIVGQNGQWAAPPGPIPTLNLGGVGNWTMTASLNSNAASSCSWDNESTT